MLRKSIVAVTLSLLSVGGLHAEDETKSGTLMKWLQGPSIGRPHVSKSADSGIQHAVVTDADKQAASVRQTSSSPEDESLKPAVAAPIPTPAPPIVEETRTALAPMIDATPVSRTTRTVSGEYVPSPTPDPAMHAPVSSVPMTSGQYVDGGYVQGAPVYGSVIPGSLYPAPRPGIPHQVGGTIIPTHALHPHEMLYPHRYKSMYGPYYYKVRGHWMVTPFGVWSNENWKLKGTTVDVKYKSHISPFALFHRPVIR